MLDSLEEEDNSEDGGNGGGSAPERKRRLKVDQVKVLERHFEVENKLEPERKMKIAAELELEPKQVTIWFQNRRARWKTKQLERDYGVLKVNYDALKLDYDVLEKENASLASKVLKITSISDLKNWVLAFSYSNYNGNWLAGQRVEGKSKERRNRDENSKRSENGSVERDSNRDGNSYISMLNCFEFSGKVYENQTQFTRAMNDDDDDQSLVNIEEPCNFCSVDQAPSLHW